MANLTETARWEAGIYQFETSDPVMGGPNGIDNRPTRELANRTLWLKTELAEAVASIGQNKTAADQGLATKADKTVRIIAGNGLTGGNTLEQNITVALGLPGKITGSTTNSVSATSHTHEIDNASTTTPGVVKLNDTLSSQSTSEALTANQGRQLKNFIDNKSDLKTVDFADNTSSGHIPSGFYRNNGRQLDGQALPPLDIHINHPGYSGLAYSRGIGFSYGGTWAVWTTSYDQDGRYLGMKKILTEDNGVLNSTQVIAGNGLIDGGSLAENRTITLGTPSTITGATGNTTTTTSHTHAIQWATTGVAGVVRLSTATDSTATNMAATPSAVKAAYDLAAIKADLSDFPSLRVGNGYQKLPNGLILQWGSVSIDGDSAVKITFPIAFPNAVLNAQSTVNGGGAIGGATVLSSHVGSLSATGMTVAMTENGVPGAKPVYWFAIGY